ncbi:SCPU domain-containing protein, partial [bacterium]
MMRATSTLLAVVGLGSLLMVSHPPDASAASANTTFAVQASVLSSCSVTALPLVFGVYSPTAASPVDASTTISVFCTLNSAYTLKLNVGTGGGTYATRTLTDGSNTLNFNLYTTSARSSIWG